MSWRDIWREWRCAWFHGASAVCLTSLATFVMVIIYLLRVGDSANFVNSATYSPAQASVTNAAKIYSAYSQYPSDEFKDETSDVIRIILRHKQRERIALLICLASLLAMLVMKIIAAWRR